MKVGEQQRMIRDMPYGDLPYGDSVLLSCICISVLRPAEIEINNYSHGTYLLPGPRT
uniref:Uncharacterized protein n=1 Tax=Cucumis melo TaxID=3656 RepID=A0A9I9EG16_CUCME